jgi:CRP/FNR family cyclic AMP-dependent transcriptional regulator
MTDLHSYLPVLKSGRWFAQLPDGLALALLGMARLRQLAPGEVLFLRNSPPCGLYAVLRGAIRISGMSGHGSEAQAAKEAVLIVLPPPVWFGEISVFDGSARTHNAHATGPTTLLHIPHDPLVAWLQAHPQHWREMALLMADKLRLAFVTLEEQAVLPAPVRLARRLVQMALGYGQIETHGASRRSLAVTQEQLALMLGISRQTTNGILNGLKEQGVIQVQRGQLEILDWAALQQLAQHQP